MSAPGYCLCSPWSPLPVRAWVLTVICLVAVCRAVKYATLQSDCTITHLLCHLLHSLYSSILLLRLLLQRSRSRVDAVVQPEHNGEHRPIITNVHGHVDDWIRHERYITLANGHFAHFVAGQLVVREDAHTE